MKALWGVLAKRPDPSTLSLTVVRNLRDMVLSPHIPEYWGREYYWACEAELQSRGSASFLSTAGGRGVPPYSFRVDREDLERGAKLKWYWQVKAGFYTRTPDPHGIRCAAPRWVLGLTNPDLYITHVNGDNLDNRRENLKIVKPGLPGVRKPRRVSDNF